jgi:uncharacterized alpha-E superfamily protein
VLSRSAEAVYWMARYAERAENVARFLDVSLQVMLDLPDARVNPWESVILATGDREGFEARRGAPTRDAVIEYLTINPDSPNSILSCLHRARENARSIRDAISSEMWEQINKWYLGVREFASSRAVALEPHELLSAVKEASHQFVGATYLTMTHGEAWHFGRLGRLLERADQTSRIIEAKEALLSPRADVPEQPLRDGGLDGIDLSALLRSVSALEMYRKRFGRIEHRNVIAFLVLDDCFPRSIRYGLDKALESLSTIVGASSGAATVLPGRVLGRLAAEYQYATVEEILAQGTEAHMDSLQRKLNAAGEAIFDTFFAAKPDAAPQALPDEAQAAQAAQ